MARHTFKNLAANAARFLKCVWPFYDIAKKRVKYTAASERNYFEILFPFKLFNVELFETILQ